MSRFFRGASDSESSSSDEQELYSEEDEEKSEESSSEESSSSSSSEDEVSGAEDEAEGGSQFIKGGKYEDSDESEDEGKRVVRSARDKRLGEIESSIRLIENAEKINDWVVITVEFDKLNRYVEKVKQSGRAPKLYIKAVADLEEYMNESIAKDKASTKKMNAANARALNTIKQRIKKNNRLYEQEIGQYRANKDGYTVEDEEEEKSLPKAKKERVAIWETAVPTLEDDEGFATVGRGGKAVQYTPESIFKHLRAIIESRGKKNTDKLEQIRTMEKLLEISQTPYQKIMVLLALVSTRFDLTTGASNYMSTEQWKNASTEFNILLESLENNSNFIVHEQAEEWEDDEKAPNLAPNEVFSIPGSVVSYIERLDDELTRSLQNIDPHTTEYIERLADEGVLYSAVLRSQAYYERIAQQPLVRITESLNRVINRRLEHVYFKPGQVVETVEENSWNSLPNTVKSTITPRSTTPNATNLINILCTYLYKHDQTVLRTRAMLCHIYHYALHNKFYHARDMLLMSHLQENIHNADINTQILYNRMLVQVGLCAFRTGLINEAQTALQEICGTNRLKELLAQGVQIQRYTQVSPEQERLERQRQLPFHMHINLELLECAYLTCSMLLEIPALAAAGSSPDTKKRAISKTFRRMLEYHERQIFTGPPENTRDHVMQASKALAAGEWKRCSELIHAIKIWDLLPERDRIKDMLAVKIQEEGLRTYLFTYAPFYDTVGVDRLADMFDLTERKVSALVSKMIAHEEIAAALDQVKNVIIFRKGVELSRLQSLALTLSERASSLIESNERVLEQKTAGLGFEGAARAGRGGRGGREGGRGDGGDRRGGRGRGRGGNIRGAVRA